MTVRIDAELAKQANRISAALDISLPDYLDSIIGPALDRDAPKAAKKLMEKKRKPPAADSKPDC